MMTKTLYCMKQRYHNSPAEVSTMSTRQLRENFLMEGLMKENEFTFVYSHYDRVITGGLIAAETPLQLPTYDNLKSDFFLERRELGIINTAGDGEITVDGTTFQLSKLDCLYIGKGSKDVNFKSISKTDPAKFVLISTPAHHAYPVTLMKKADASPAELGATVTANERTIYKYIHLDGIKSCQLVMGLTVLKPGSVWNTMPSHTHDRRMEIYYYFDLKDNNVVFHMMGQPQETKHLVVNNDQAIISPPWSIHSGSGTSNYTFIWAMAGENQSFADMDFVELSALR